LLSDKVVFLSSVLVGFAVVVAAKDNASPIADAMISATGRPGCPVFAFQLGLDLVYSFQECFQEAWLGPAFLRYSSYSRQLIYLASIIVSEDSKVLAMTLTCANVHIP
jgi:hypothetical protein